MLQKPRIWAFSCLLSAMLSCLVSCGADYRGTSSGRGYPLNKVSTDPAWDPGSKEGPTYETPTRNLPVSEWPPLEDDIDFDGMNEVIRRQLERYSELSLSGQVRLGQDLYPLTAMRVSLELFQQLVDETRDCLMSESRSFCMERFNLLMQEKFNVYIPNLTKEDPRAKDDESTLFTAYYTPTLKGKLAPDDQFKFGVYKNPKNSELRNKTRVQIDFKNAYKGQDLGLFYFDKVFDVYLLHIEGGGRVEINENGQRRSYYLSFDGTNGKKWNFISTYMMEKKMIDDPSVDSQREYIEAHPEKLKEIFAQCPSYVYFKLTKTPPIGSDMVPLTDGRSLATDRHHYRFKGMLTFVNSRRPAGKMKAPHTVPSKIPFSRFWLDQDTGGAIKGKARADLYFGEGHYAELAASSLKETGNIFYLMMKKPKSFSP